ncbi:hypothetical protein CsatB_025451 [Cannabis sativa]
MMIINNNNRHHQSQMIIPLFVLVILFSSILDHNNSLLCEGSRDIDIPLPTPPQSSSDVVIIKNRVKKSDLTVHCKSKNDDLGVHVLKYDQSYRFSFTPNFWRSTLFFCGFKWKGEFHWFDIYKTHHRFVYHINSWIILPTGPCLYNSNHQAYDYCYPWNPDKKKGLQLFPALN